VYAQNTGLRIALLNSAAFLYLLWYTSKRATSGTLAPAMAVAALLLVLVGLFGPYVIRGVLVRHAKTTIWCCRGLLAVVFGLILSTIFSPLPVPDWAIVPVLFAASLAHGMTFWLFSDERVVTLRRLTRHPTEIRGG
jgi:quinol-cytochrome oxidoreductase complex cytochrome b subunit